MEDTPKQLGDFEILRELGRGGMGVVYEARQKSLNRRVALKVLSTGLGLTTKAIMRFKREAEAAAKLHHTHIVPVYFTGDEGRVPYYAMELVDGPSLDQLIRQMRNGLDVPSNDSLTSPSDASPGQPNDLPNWIGDTIGLEQLSRVDGAVTSNSVDFDSSSSFGEGSTYFDNMADMMSGVADALAHAHDQGVIHRDIKPSNLLLSQDGRLSVNDFGLARMLEQPGMTISGELMGSPMYMSPEQIAVGRIPLDHRTDIYSLGATLYELLTLQTPFDGKQRDQVLSQIIHKEPLSPRSINKRIPQDLETICLKAMEKDPDRRYQTAEQMAKDLQCFVNRHAISARRISPIERGMRWAKRHRALTAAIGCGVILAAVALTYAARGRAIRREYAAEVAMASAMSGDLEEAFRLTGEAKNYGASADWVEKLYGQLELSRGENEKAIGHLQRALQLKPNDVTTVAMLANAYASDGQWDPYLELLDQLEKETVETPESLVFVSQAWSWVDPKRAISIADRAMKRSRSPLGFTTRAHVRAIHAYDARNLSLAENALDDARFALELLGTEGSLADVTQLYCRLVTADLYAKAGQEARSSELLELANENVKRLERSPRNLSACYVTAMYHWQNGDHDAAFAAFSSVGKMGYGSEIVVGCAYDADELERALNRFTDLAEPWDENQAILCLGIRGRKGEAEEILGQLRGPTSATLLLLLGKRDELKQSAAAELDSDSKFTRYHPFWRPICMFHAGRIARAEFLQAAQGSARDTGMAHYHIGIAQLADGDRLGAKSSFQKSVVEGCIDWSEVIFSRAFLAMMSRDADWPWWIPPKS